MSTHDHPASTTAETMTATTMIDAPAGAIFAILADPSAHATIEGTGWVRESRECARLTEQGQIFRMAMYHENHPDKDYEMANRVEVFDPPKAIAWQPGQDVDDSNTPRLGGWTWRYDLTPASPTSTEVTLTYDWSAVPKPNQFPPFEVEYLENSLRHLAERATQTQ